MFNQHESLAVPTRTRINLVRYSTLNILFIIKFYF